MAMGFMTLMSFPPPYSALRSIGVIWRPVVTMMVATSTSTSSGCWA
jgi:hypothetical protein